MYKTPFLMKDSTQLGQSIINFAFSFSTFTHTSVECHTSVDMNENVNAMDVLSL